MSINILATIGRNNELRKNKKLIWIIPEDMKFYEKIIKIDNNKKNYLVIDENELDILPRKLFNSNLIVLGDKKLEKYYDIVCYSNVKEIIKYFNKENLFIYGDVNIYEKFIDYTDNIYLTELDSVDYEADSYFPWFDLKEWDIQNILEDTIDKNILYKRNKYVRKRVK